MTTLSTTTPTGIAALDPEAVRAPSQRGRRRAADWLRERSPTHQLVTDPEFRAICKPLRDQERAGLRADIARNGCLQPLIAWWDGERLLLVDGYHRLEICEALNAWCEVLAVPFADRAEARRWIATHQASRRNLTPAERDELLARDYFATAQPRGGDRKKSKAQAEPLNDGQTTPKQKTAAEQVAEKHGVSPATVKRAVETQRAKTELAKGANTPHPTLKDLSHSQVKQLAKLPAAERSKILDGGKPAVKAALATAKRKQSTGASSRSPDQRRGTGTGAGPHYHEVLTEFLSLADRMIDTRFDAEIRTAILAWIDAGKIKLTDFDARQATTKGTKSTKRKPR